MIILPGDLLPRSIQRVREDRVILIDRLERFPDQRQLDRVTGAIEIGRNPGVVQVTFRAPLDRLKARGLLPFVRDQYGIG